MTYDEYPMPRAMLFGTEPDSWMIDPKMIRLAMNKPYRARSSTARLFPYAQREVPRAPRRSGGFRAFLRILHLVRP
jgi:hypothetical protein